jgi:hypothetical protein
MAPDPTEAARRALLPTMPDELRSRIQAGEQVWDTIEMRRDFDVIGFLAPYVMVRRKADGVTGSLSFTHAPRYYFDWREDTGEG